MPPDTIALAPIRTKHRPRFRRAAVEERPAFRLTDRDRELLKIIYDYRFITAPMLQDLAPSVDLTDNQKIALAKLRAAKKATAAGPDTTDRPQRTKREIQRRLALLYHAGYVQRHKIADGEPIAYALGNAGAGELMLHFGIDRKEIEWTTKNRESGIRYLEHTLLVSRFRHALEVSLQNFPGVSLEKWVPSGGFKVKVKYVDQVRTKEGMRTQNVEGTMIPDGHFVLIQGGKRVHYFLECDRSNMSNDRFLQKLKRYYAYWRYVAEDKRIAEKKHEKPKTDITQMRVISVTISEARKDNLRETAQQVSTTAKELFWFACEKAYRGKPDEMLGTIWQTLKDNTLMSVID